MNLEDIEKRDELLNDTLNLKQINHKNVRIGSVDALMKIKIEKKIQEFKSFYVKEHCNQNKEELIIRLSILDRFKEFIEDNQ